MGYSHRQFRAIDDTGRRTQREGFLACILVAGQLWLMAVTPLGLSPLIVCAIRLNGPRMLQRVIGTESERGASYECVCVESS